MDVLSPGHTDQQIHFSVQCRGQNLSTHWYTVIYHPDDDIRGGGVPTNPVLSRMTLGLWCHTLAGIPWLLCSKLWWWSGNAPALPCPVTKQHIWEIVCFSWDQKLFFSFFLYIYLLKKNKQTNKKKQPSHSGYTSPGAASEGWIQHMNNHLKRIINWVIPARRNQKINLFVLRGNGESLTASQQKIISPVMCWLSPHPVNRPGCALCFVAMPGGTKKWVLKKLFFFLVLFSDRGKTVKALKTHVWLGYIQSAHRGQY